MLYNNRESFVTFLNRTHRIRTTGPLIQYDDDWNSKSQIFAATDKQQQQKAASG